MILTIYSSIFIRFSCPQQCRDLAPLCPRQISEDCLFLNIWTPFKNESELRSDPTPNRPVLIIIHGGSFQFGSATMDALDANELAGELNAIVVAMNYRLGLFGFVSDLVGDAMNLGILDQAVAIDWVVENIHLFGGDASKISILGQSAGAMSALIHASHNRRFENVILMSVPAVQFRTTQQAEADIRRLGNAVACDAEERSLFKSCMLQKSTYELMDLMQKLDEGSKISSILPPIIDGTDIIAHPFDILADPKWFKGVNVVIGTVSNETSYSVNKVFHGKLRGSIFNVAMDVLFNVDSQKVVDKYQVQGVQEFTDDHSALLSQIETDHLFACPTIDALQRQKAAGAAATTFYSYFWELPWLGSNDDTVGRVCGSDACHTTDLAVLLKRSSDPFGSNTTTLFRTFLHSLLDPQNGSVHGWKPWNANSESTMVFGTKDENNTFLVDRHPRMGLCDSLKQVKFDYQLGSDVMVRDLHTLRQFSASFLWSLAIIFILVQAVCLVKSFMYFKRVDVLVTSLSHPFGPISPRLLMTNNYDLELGKMIGSSKDLLTESTPNPVNVECKDLQYTIFKSSADRVGSCILQNVVFDCLPGTFNAIIGPSGSGKTSLLSLLANRVVNIKAQSHIKFSGKQLSAMSQSELQRTVGFVPQHSPPFTGLTAVEILVSYAKLELPSGTPESVLQARVAHIIKLLGLSPCANVIIKDASEHKGGLSGGQLRRIPIAIALLRKPSVLILDEPTSGLDAKASLEVMSVLSSLSQCGYNVIISIHQPRREIFDLFDQVILLAQGQLLISATPTDCIAYCRRVKAACQQTRRPSVSSLDLSETQFEHEAMINPADLILDIASAVPSEKLKHVVQLGLDMSKSKAYRESKDTAYRKSSQFEVLCTDNTGSRDKIESHPHAGIVTQAIVINARWWKKRPLIRKLSMLMITFASTILFGFLERRTGDDAITLGLQVKGLMLACIGLGALKNINISFDYYEDRDLYDYDATSGCVSPIAFFLHRLVYETSMATLEATTGGVLAYMLLGCPTDTWRFSTVILLLLAYYNTIVSFYTVIYSTRLNRSEARSVSFFAQAVLMITSGIWISEGDTMVYGWISWLQNINPNYWVLSPLLRNILAQQGKCLWVDHNSQCRAWEGDFMIENTRLASITSGTSLGALCCIFVSLRLIQLMLLSRDAYQPKISKMFHQKSVFTKQ